MLFLLRIYCLAGEKQIFDDNLQFHRAFSMVKSSEQILGKNLA